MYNSAHGTSPGPLAFTNLFAVSEFEIFVADVDESGREVSFRAKVSKFVGLGGVSLLVITYFRVIVLTLRVWFRRIEVRSPAWRVGFTRALSFIEVDLFLSFIVGSCVCF